MGTHCKTSRKIMYIHERENTSHILNRRETFQSTEIITRNNQKILCAVIYSATGGESVVGARCDDTYSSKRWHPFLLAARFAFCSLLSKESNYIVLYTSHR